MCMLSCDWAALQQTHALEFIYGSCPGTMMDVLIKSAHVLSMMQSLTRTRPLDDATIENTFEEQASTPSQVLPQKWKHSAYPKN